MVILLAVTPLPPLVGVDKLAERWSIGKSAVPRWISSEGFPPAEVVGQTQVWAEADIQAWEDARREAGLPIPGERPRGKEPHGGR